MLKEAVSVVIPAYNSAETIVEALESVLRQELTTESTEHTEIIVVDDCSTDDTCDVVTEWREELEQSSAKHNRLTNGKQRSGNEAKETKRISVRLLRLDKNGGPARARNAGVQEAKGEWIAFLDSDDAWLPDRLAVQMWVLEDNPDAVMVCGGTVPLRDDVDGGLWRVECGEPEVTELELRDFSMRNPVATSTVLLKRDVVEGLGGFRGRFRGPEDYDLWMRIAAECKILKVEHPVSCYRHTSGSLSLDDRKFLPQVLSVLDAAYGSSGVMAGRYRKSKAVSHQLLAASWMAMERGALLRALSLYVRGFARWPFSKGDPSFRFEKIRLAAYLCKKAVNGIFRRPSSDIGE